MVVTGGKAMTLQVESGDSLRDVNRCQEGVEEMPPTHLPRM